MDRADLLKIAKPILFNTEMVRAIQDNRKTQTRRLIKPPYFVDTNGTPMAMRSASKGSYVYRQLGAISYPETPIKADNTLYVRETWQYSTDLCGEFPEPIYMATFTAAELAEAKQKGYRWKPSIHMPKEAARIFLEVTGVRVERLQDITEDDAIEEGAARVPGVSCTGTSARIVYADIWDNTIKPADKEQYGWSANPWVFVYEFERVLPDG